ncbi:hypothetical protein EJ06DRAFT_231201 [Trichodelitschia bisporula]|uniref:Uncharacterized protein n=1 Tax=Trichodelitschia bisporula TaxID=703511 RepID=A0A6G1HL34_9PEZI|nr:hypothetical protein EJ06DRAFT_231201 [Trichodelitschia bisporula]
MGMGGNAKSGRIRRGTLCELAGFERAGAMKVKRHSAHPSFSGRSLFRVIAADAPTAKNSQYCATVVQASSTLPCLATLMHRFVQGYPSQTMHRAYSFRGVQPLRLLRCLAGGGGMPALRTVCASSSAAGRRTAALSHGIWAAKPLYGTAARVQLSGKDGVGARLGYVFAL